jgi:hypothetical protein
VSEKMTGAEHTKMDDDFTKLEQHTDVYVEMQVIEYDQLMSEKMTSVKHTKIDENG